MQSHNSPDGGLDDLNDDGEDDSDHDGAGDLNDEDGGGDFATCCLQTHNSHGNKVMLLIMMIKIIVYCWFFEPTMNRTNSFGE